MTEAELQAQCSEPDCFSPAVARGLCNAHYKRRRKAGSLPPRRRQVTTYDGMHASLRYHLGSPDCCADCGRVGPTEWALRWRGLDPAVLVHDIATRRRFSTSVDDYAAICRSCHRQYDRSDPATCSVETCGRLAWARGWCGTHYRRWADCGDVRADVPIRAMR